MDRSDTVLPPGAVQSFVRSLSQVVLDDDNDDKSLGLQGARLDTADQWHGKEPSVPADAFASSGNTLSQESALVNEHLANSNQADGFSERDSHIRQEDIMIMQESNEEPTIFETTGREAEDPTEESESQFYTTAPLENETVAYFDIDRQDSNMHDIMYEDSNSPVLGNAILIYDGIEESLERMNSPNYKTALSIYDVFEDSLERNVNGETNTPDGVKGSEESNMINSGSDLSETEKTITGPELQTYGQKVISKAGLVPTIDGDLETENSDRQEIEALPLVGTDSAAEQIVRNPSTDTEPAPLPDLVKAKNVINQLSEETASQPNATKGKSDIMILETSTGASWMGSAYHSNLDDNNLSKSHPNEKSVSVDPTVDIEIVDHKMEAHKYLHPETSVFASESESLFHWEDSLYGRNKIHADLDHPLETFF